MLSIHFGIRETELQTLKDQIKRMLPDESIEIQTDEIPWNPDGPERVQHCVIDTWAPMSMINMMAVLYKNFLVPSTQDNIDGTSIFVADKNDPTAEYVELRWPS